MVNLNIVTTREPNGRIVTKVFGSSPHNRADGDGGVMFSMPFSCRSRNGRGGSEVRRLLEMVTAVIHGMEAYCDARNSTTHTSFSIQYRRCKFNLNLGHRRVIVEKVYGDLPCPDVAKRVATAAVNSVWNRRSTQ